LNRRKEDVLAWESRWSLPVAAVTIVAVILIVASGPIGSFGGSGEAQALREWHAHPNRIVVSSLLQALGILMLGFPLFFLFRAVRSRSDRIRPQLIGLVVVAPIFLAVSGALTIGARDQAASLFVHGEAKSTLSAPKAKEECETQESEKSAKDFAGEFTIKKGETAMAACERRKVEDKEASNAVGEASLSSVASGLGIAGGLGLLASLVYSCLWAVRVGLLTRFWGTLGMASGVAFLLGPLFVVTMLWMIYFATILLVRKLRPPAWAAGEAVPWPSAGERMAKELEPKDGGPAPDDGDGDVGGTTIGSSTAELPEGVEAPEPAEAPESNGDSSSGGDGPQRRKRKRRG
jgi:hypothetical protein